MNSQLSPRAKGSTCLTQKMTLGSAHPHWPPASPLSASFGSDRRFKTGVPGEGERRLSSDPPEEEMLQQAQTCRVHPEIK